MNLAPHFTLEEFTFSETASRKGLDNELPTALYLSAKETCRMLERVRDKLSEIAGKPVPLVITSGYRSPAVNQAVGGSKGSDHLTARAADFRAPAFGSPFQIASALAPFVGELEIGQLIHEFGSWVHVSTKRPEKNLNRVLTISSRGTETGIQRA